LSAFIQDIPAWVLGVTVIALSLGYVMVGIEAVGRIEPPETRHTYNDIVGFVIAVVGVVYAVLLAFVAVAAWERVDAADATVAREAGMVGDIRRLAEGLSPDVGAPLREAAISYARTVRDSEWAAMGDGERPVAAEADLENIERLILAHEPASVTETNVQARLLGLLTDLFDARRDRLIIADAKIQPFIWLTLVAGFLVLVGMTFMFGLEKMRHRTLSGLTAVSTGLVLAMIVELDRPFMGSVAVDTEPFDIVLEAAGAAP
jgi:hypothetical protein